MAKLLLLISIFLSCNSKVEYLNKSILIANDEKTLKSEIIKNAINLNLDKYQNHDCPSDTFNIIKYSESFQGFKNLGDLNSDNLDDSIFILEPLNRCEEGQSYYFSDPKIERIFSGSMCCHLFSIENIGDINEDGFSEIAEYYSSCASRYKAITIYSLKHTKWQEIISFSYVLNENFNIETDLKKLFRKKAKSKLEYLEISDVDINGRVISQWKEIYIQ